MAHALFFQKRFEEYKKFVLSIKDEMYIAELKFTYANRLLQDFDEFEKVGLILKDYKTQFDEIKKILELSIKKE